MRWNCIWKALRFLQKDHGRTSRLSSFCRTSDHKNLIQKYLDNAFIDFPYCAFHKHANSKVQKPPSHLRFLLSLIVITITSNGPWNTETHTTDGNPPITNHKPWPYEPVNVKFCFFRGRLRWLTAAKNAIVRWLLNFRIRMFVKSAVKCWMQCNVSLSSFWPLKWWKTWQKC